MPIVGFIDSVGSQWSFAEIDAGKGNFLTRRGDEAPRALVRALAKSYRAADHYGDDKVVSVTTLISPIQKVLLERRHDLYVEWDDSLWATFGTVEHALFETGAGENDIVEHKLVIERGGVKIGGTFDLLELAQGSIVENHRVYRGRDYKVTSAYGTKLMAAATGVDGLYREKPDYFWQAQLYHLMTQDPDVKCVYEIWDDGELIERQTQPWRYAGKVKIEDWKITCIVRDWNERQHGSKIGPIEIVNVPLLPLERVENYLNQRVTLLAASSMATDETLPICTEEETWGGKRCQKYCAAYQVCLQANPQARFDA